MNLTGIGKMKLRVAFLSVFAFFYLAGRASDIPSVLILGDDSGSTFGPSVEKALVEKLVFYPQSESPKVKYVPVGGVAGAADYLKQVKRGDFRVLLLCCADTETAAAACRRLSARAGRLEMEMLWFGCRDGYASLHGICFADYDGFLRSLKKEDEMRRCEYIAESAAQWWTGMARGNRGVERVRLWDDKPPHYEFRGPEYINSLARIDRISEPELEIFLPRQAAAAPAVIFFPGGGYSFTGFLRNARELAELLIPQGIAVIGVKYRVKQGAEIAFEDGQRALRLVRSRAREWNIDPARVGVAGQSAGAHLVLNLATRFTPGDSGSADLVERQSSRPDFAAPLTNWNFGTDDCPFVFGPQTPPFFVRQARNDSGFSMAEKLVEALQKAGVRVNWRFVDTGGHGAFEIEGPDGGCGWPAEFVEWLEKERIITK